MAFQLETGFCVSSSSEAFIRSKTRKPFHMCNSNGSLQFKESGSNDFLGKSVHFSNQKGLQGWKAKAPKQSSILAQASICVSKSLRWWEKTLKPNMIEIYSAQELVDSLLNAGDRLVIVDFYSPGCGGCKALHPKICQLAESNPHAIFLKVNYEELRTMCYSLRIHVLPFFRFYRGAEGKICSFSCTNATVKKFKGALAKYGTNLCSGGLAKGLDESELLSLASNGQISMGIIPPTFSSSDSRMDDLVVKTVNLGHKEKSAILA